MAAQIPKTGQKPSCFIRGYASRVASAQQHYTTDLLRQEKAARKIVNCRKRANLQRLSYIDWMRGLACLLMFQAHCYDSWLRPELHQTYFYRLSQIAATLPAPLFIFLAGVSFALVTEKLREKGVDRGAIAKQTMLRGDVLNILGVSMVLMGVFCWFTAGGEVEAARRRSVLWSVAVAVAIGLLTPPLWTTWRPNF